MVGGLRAQEIYNSGLSQFPVAKDKLPLTDSGVLPPPHKGHPFQSMKYLKKTVLPEMMLRGEVEKVHIARGKVNDEGQRMDAIKSMGYHTTYASNIVDRKDEWRWRLIPEDDVERHKGIVANVPEFRKRAARGYIVDRLPPLPGTPNFCR